MKSLFNETFVFGKENLLNHIRIGKIKDKFLLTTDHGAWVLVNKEEFDKIKQNKFSEEEFKFLEEKGIILTKNNTGQILDLYKKRYNFLFHGAGLHIIVPTPRCNHRCVYCHASAVCSDDKEKDMTQETATKILEFIFQTPAKTITLEFQGGDALLNVEIFKFVVSSALEMNKTHKKNMDFALVTNLTLMTDELMQFCIDNSVNVCTSLDGPKQVHDANRKYINGSSHEHVVKWIKKFNEHGKKVGALMVTTKNSLPFYKEIVDEYVNLEIPLIQIKYMSSLGFAKEIDGYSVEEFIEFWKKSLNYIIELNKKGVNIKERGTAIILQKLLTPFDAGHLDFRSPCGICSGQICYNFDGSIYGCDEGRCYDLFKVGDVFKDNYESIFKKEETQQLIKASLLENYLCDTCVYKPYCGTCIVNNYSDYGSLLPKLNKDKCLMRKKMFDYVFELLMDVSTRDVLVGWI
jgi:uncharacterized protein